MHALAAGDLVLGGVDSVTAVVVNQHRRSGLASALLSIRTAAGEALAVTPDHVVQLNGVFSAARAAKSADVLSTGDVISAVTRFRGAVVNPITRSGTVLAASGGRPVVAATGNEWLSDVLLSAYPKYTLSFNLAVLFPATTQLLYDALLEPFFNAHARRLEARKAALPAPLVSAGLIAGDAALAASLAAALCSSPLVLAMA